MAPLAKWSTLYTDKEFSFGGFAVLWYYSFHDSEGTKICSEILDSFTSRTVRDKLVTVAILQLLRF